MSLYLYPTSEDISPESGVGYLEDSLLVPTCSPDSVSPKTPPHYPHCCSQTSAPNYSRSKTEIIKIGRCPSDMPPKRREPISRIRPNDRWHQISNSAFTLLIFSISIIILSIVDYQLENDTTIFLPITFIISALYINFVAALAMWIFRNRDKATNISLFLALCSSFLSTLLSVSLVIVSTLALAKRNGTFDYVRTGAQQRRYYQNSSQNKCQSNCTRYWLILMLISCGFFVTCALSIYLNSLLKSELTLPKYRKSRTPAGSSSSSSNSATAKQSHTQQNGSHALNGGLGLSNGHIRTGSHSRDESAHSSTQKSNNELYVTSNPYIGFRLGKLVTEEYIQMSSRSGSPVVMGGGSGGPGGAAPLQTIVATTVVNQHNGQTYSISNFSSPSVANRVDIVNNPGIPKSPWTLASKNSQTSTPVDQKSSLRPIQLSDSSDSLISFTGENHELNLSRSSSRKNWFTGDTQSLGCEERRPSDRTPQICSPRRDSSLKSQHSPFGAPNSSTGFHSDIQVLRPSPRTNSIRNIRDEENNSH